MVAGIGGIYRLMVANQNLVKYEYVCKPFNCKAARRRTCKN